jgi:hypothetical protein
MTQEKIDATDAPPQGAVEWLIEQVGTILHEGEIFINGTDFTEEVKQALQIQEHMVRHAYNHGWDDRHHDVKESWMMDADEKFYKQTYGTE